MDGVIVVVDQDQDQQADFLAHFAPVTLFPYMTQENIHQCSLQKYIVRNMKTHVGYQMCYTRLHTKRGNFFFHSSIYLSLRSKF